MAKAIIILEDAEDGKSVDIQVKFEPAVDEKSAAHHMASAAIQLFQECHQTQDEEPAR